MFNLARKFQDFEIVQSWALRFCLFCQHFHIYRRGGWSQSLAHDGLLAKDLGLFFLSQELGKGGSSKGGFCGVECHAQGCCRFLAERIFRGFIFLSRRISFCGFGRRIFSPLFVGKTAQKSPPGKSPAKSSKIYTTKIPDTVLQRGRPNAGNKNTQGYSAQQYIWH